MAEQRRASIAHFSLHGELRLDVLIAQPSSQPKDYSARNREDRGHIDDCTKLDHESDRKFNYRTVNVALGKKTVLHTKVGQIASDRSINSSYIHCEATDDSTNRSQIQPP